jgi:Zn-dependent protease
MEGVFWSNAALLACFACILLHELGHSLTAMAFGIGVRRIILTPIGGVAEFDRIPRRPSRELLITIAGPLVNFAIALVLWFVVAFPDGWADDPTIASFADLGRVLLYWNIAIGLFNLIPAFPMDGGRILRALLSLGMPYVRATFWAATVAKVIAILGIPVALYFHAYTTAVIFVFIMGMGEAEYRSVRLRDRQEAQWRELLEHQFGPPPAKEPAAP